MIPKLKQLARFLCSLGGCILAQNGDFGVDFARDWERAKTRFTYSMKLALYGWLIFFGAQMFVDILAPFLTAGIIRWALVTSSSGILICTGLLGVICSIRIAVPILNSNAFAAPNHGVSPKNSWFRALICKLPGCYTCMNIQRAKAMRNNYHP